MAVGIVLPDPFPGVMQPRVALRLGQDRKPGDLIITRDEDGAVAGMPLITAPEVIKLDQERKMFAGPAAGRNAAFTAREKRVGIADLKLPLERLIGHLRNAQRKGVGVEQQMSVLHIPAGRGMGVANHKMSAGM